jgi:hypothetical protein
MRNKLMDLAKHIERMQKAATPSIVIQSVRDDALTKIFNERVAEKEEKLKEITKVREGVIELFSEKKLSPLEAVARSMQLNDRYSSMPLETLKKIPLDKLENDELRVLSGTFRRRAAHELADRVYGQIQSNEQKYKYNPIWAAADKDEARIELCYRINDPTSIWIGSDLKDIRKEDFAERTPTGGMKFVSGKDKHGNSTYTEV